MRQLEARAFATGSTPEALMETAGRLMAGAIAEFFPKPGRARVYFGKGHNGGDALVAARHLQAAGWEIVLEPAFPAEQWSELTKRKHEQLGAAAVAGLGPLQEIVIDGLLGIGFHGPLGEPLLSKAREINRLREGSVIFAADVPSGLNADSGQCDPDAVRADFSLAVGAAKAGMVADAAVNFVGRIVVLPMPELQPGAGAAEIATPQTLAGLLKQRDFETHKGNCGRVGIIAGSRGFTGAALMCAHGALRAGAGLVSLYVEPEIYPVVAAASQPEVMVRPVHDLREILELRHDALAIGPGLGFSRNLEVLKLIRGFAGPGVVDADALTVLASDPNTLRHAAGPRLLTPHPGEMARLMSMEGLSRSAVAVRFTEQYPVALLFKGARTIVAQHDKPLSFNSTGHPGMATGGMGDVLTGVCAGLLGQGLGVYDAGRLGAWLCGRSAELALARQSQESMLPTDLLAELGAAWEGLRRGSP